MSAQEAVALADRLRRVGVPLAGATPGATTDDLRALAPIVGDARLVAIGEATHGTREFFQIKHRVFQHLVVHHGFRVFAMEADYAAGLSADAYVTEGQGRAAEALDILDLWPWSTEEVLALLEWMRAFNVGRAPGDRVRFVGIDAQDANRAVACLAGALEPLDRAMAARARTELAVLSTPPSPRTIVELERRSSSARTLHEGLLARRTEYTRPAQADSYGVAVACARACVQMAAEDAAAGVRDSQVARVYARERAMAENIRAALDDGGRSRKMMVWAHNGHVAHGELGATGVPSMMRVLADTDASRAVTIGFAFGEGSFRAREVRKDGRTGAIRTFEVGPPQAGSLDALLASTGMAVGLFDIRHVEGELRAWLEYPMATREVGGTFESEVGMWAGMRAKIDYDALVFVRKTTASVPIVRQSAGSKR